MKRIICFVLIAISMTSLCACGYDEKDIEDAYKRGYQECSADMQTKIDNAYDEGFYTGSIKMAKRIQYDLFYSEDDHPILVDDSEFVRSLQMDLDMGEITKAEYYECIEYFWQEEQKDRAKAEKLLEEYCQSGISQYDD